MTAPTELGRGRYLSLCVRDGYEYVTRVKGSGVVGIIAYTPHDELLMVEQYRPAVGRRVIELPAGLVGDNAGSEDAMLAAHRELEEETGWQATNLKLLGRFPSSAGLTDEMHMLFHATGLTRVGNGGGVAAEGENITVHVIPRDQVIQYVAGAQAKSDSPVLVDGRVYYALTVGL